MKYNSYERGLNIAGIIFMLSGIVFGLLRFDGLAIFCGFMILSTAIEQQSYFWRKILGEKT
jgi:inner membrane protein involved in colicin E2 resistance